MKVRVTADNGQTMTFDAKEIYVDLAPDYQRTRSGGWYSPKGFVYLDFVKPSHEYVIGICCKEEPHPKELVDLLPKM